MRCSTCGYSSYFRFETCKRCGMPAAQNANKNGARTSRRYAAALGSMIATLAVGAFVASTNRTAPANSYRRAPAAPRPASPQISDGLFWFRKARSSCNSVEAAAFLERTPPPPGPLGLGYAAACLTLAGRMENARALIETLPEADRGAAAAIVFDTIHPVADAGDDAAALPGMLLTLDYAPDNYMALYHAGIAESLVGKFEAADSHLTKFLQRYKRRDAFTRRAQVTLERVRSQRRDETKAGQWPQESEMAR